MKKLIIKRWDGEELEYFSHQEMKEIVLKRIGFEGEYNLQKIETHLDEMGVDDIDDIIHFLEIDYSLEDLESLLLPLHRAVLAEIVDREVLVDKIYISEE